MSEQGGDDRDDRARRVYKAHLIGEDVHAQQSVRDEDSDQLRTLLAQKDVLDPPYDPKTLLRIWENSSSLGQNIQAYVTNIDGLGFRLEPRIDLDSDESFEQVREAVWIERIRRAERAVATIDEAGTVDAAQLHPDDDTITLKVEGLRRQARLQKIRAQSFFDFASPTGSFVQLRRQTRQDLESTGNAFWEVLRNGRNEVARFVLVSPTHVRLTSIDDRPTMVDEKVQVGPLGFESVEQPKFFRRYVQVVGQKTVWFKQFGDPRVVSAQTGKTYPDMETFERKKDKSSETPASEIIHFKIHKTAEAYGVPRWIGNLLSVLGSRAADEVNFAYFDNKSIPPLALMVSGGRLAEESVHRIETFIRDNIKGRENFHKILVIEADDDSDPMGTQEHPKLTFERLSDVQKGDALFQNYDERNIDKVGSSFRMPRLMRGDIRDFNRATANAAIRFADEQVFEPERTEFDSWINRQILPCIDITLWKFRSLGPKTRDPETVAELTLKAHEQGILMTNEVRRIFGDILGMDFDPITAGWAQQPLQLTLAGFPAPELEEDVATRRDEMEAEGAELAGTSAAARLRLLTSEANQAVARAEAMREAASRVARQNVDDAALAGIGKDLLVKEKRHATALQF